MIRIATVLLALSFVFMTHPVHGADKQEEQNKKTVAVFSECGNHRKRRSAMCFEFEYLYWAKLEEEARQRKEEEEARKRAAQGAPGNQPQPQQQPVPV